LFTRAGSDAKNDGAASAIGVDDPAAETFGAGYDLDGFA
jgi:hypothetical protein